MARSTSLSSSLTTSESLTVAFQKLVVEYSGSIASKVFYDVSVEVVSGGKEIYFGSNYKVKWKHVTGLEVWHDDFAEGFSMLCPASGSGSAKDDRRSFLVKCPIDGPVGWKPFASLLTAAYQKECRKRRRKQERLAAEQEELKEEEVRKRKQRSGRSGSRNGNRRSTYSRRPYDFMRNNAANIAHNAEVWSDDEDEKDRNRAQPDASETESPPHGSESESKIKPEPEEPIADGGVEVQDSDNDSDNNNNNDGYVRRRAPVLEDSDSDDSSCRAFTRPVTRPVTRPSILSPKRRSTMATNEDDNENENENGDKGASVTTTRAAVQRVVTPALSTTPSPTKNRTMPKPRRYLEEDDDDEEEEDRPKNTKKTPINSFFQPRSMAAAAGSRSVTKSANATTNLPSRVHDGSRAGANDDGEDDIWEHYLSSSSDDGHDSQSGSQSPSRPLFSASASKRIRSNSVHASAIAKRHRLKSLGPSKSQLETLKFGDGGSREIQDPFPSELDEEFERSPPQPQRLWTKGERVTTNRERSSGWRGLHNDGNSCYVNSSLQQLVSVPAFMEALVERRAGHKLVGELANLYEDLFRSSEPGDRSSATVSAKGVKTVMDRLTDRFRGRQQRDAHEFLGELIDRIHEELVPSSRGKESGRGNNDQDNDTGTGSFEAACRRTDSPERGAACPPAGKKAATATDVEPTDEFFRWNVRVCLECKHCGYSRSKEEMHRYLSIDIGHENINPWEPGFVKPAVDSCLARFFSPEDREIDCEKCKVGKVATQTMTIRSLPKVILLHLKRFIVAERFGVGTGAKELVLKKNKVPVELSHTLSIDQTLLNLDDDDGDGNFSGSKSYKLRSVVHHLGNTLKSGHYTTDALRTNPLDGKDRWVSYDDGNTGELEEETVVGSNSNQNTAYMLLYSES
eukprot:jgi/Psemu1/287871/fgenesh1_pg.219_\